MQDEKKIKKQLIEELKGLRLRLAEAEAKVNDRRDDKGRPIQMVGIARDITDQKHLQKSLRESEYRFRMLTSSSPVGIFQADTRGKGVYVNPAICAFTGLPAEKHKGDGWTTAVHPDDREAVQRLWKAAVKGEASFESEFRFVGKKKMVTWVKSQAAAVKDGDGNIFGYIGTLTDISKKKRTEEKLRRSKNYLNSIIAGTYDGLMVLDRDFTITDVNPSCLRMYNGQKEAVIGQRRKPWKHAGSISDAPMKTA